jgi:hypothetical protein
LLLRWKKLKGKNARKYMIAVIAQRFGNIESQDDFAVAWKILELS